MGSQVSLLIPPPTRGSNLSGGDRKYLQTLQRRLPLETVDTSAGSYAETAPPAGVNSQSGETNQNQEITYVKTSADANVFTLNGVEGGPYTLATQLSFLKIKSDGTNWYVSAKSAAAPAAPLVLKTNGVLNGSQTLQNLVAGASIVLTDDGTGDITIASAAPSPATVIPLADSGTGAVGVSLKYARQDHVHPASGGGVVPGTLAISSVLQAVPLAVNLSTEGTFDWMYLGGYVGASLSGNLPEAGLQFKSHWKLKNGRLLHNLRFVENAQNAAGTDSSEFTYSSTSGDDASFNEPVNPPGSPLVSRAATPFWFSNNNGLFFFPFGFTWRAIPLPDLGTRTLKFYTYVNNATITLAASISDGSAPDVSSSVTNGSTAEYIFTVAVTPGSFGAILNVSLMCSAFASSASRVGISAVTMA
jgi:hypothetical protein